MAKKLLIDPATTRLPSALEAVAVPVHDYRFSIDEARASFGDERLRLLLRDMVILREFESMLDEFKRLGTYAGLTYAHLGPAHLSIGQEAAAVGQAAGLTVDDHIFGSHRSHGEIIAKGLAAIERLEPDELTAELESFRDGVPMAILDRRLPADDASKRAVQFLLYGLLAEIFGKEPGFNRGLGGSMHAFFPPFGIYPNNAIVGASAPIAVGAALYKRLFERGRSIAVANIGDGSTGCGVVWEAINFAGMRQFHTLWPERFRGGLPVLFFFFNNFYAMGGQTQGETMSYDALARMALGFHRDALHAEVVDGNDVLAVADAVVRKRPLLVDGSGPVLLDVQCYRQVGHSTSDAGAYRTREELALWRAIDPIAQYAERLEAASVVRPGAVDELTESTRRLLADVARLAVDDEISPRLRVTRRGRELEALMFSDGVEEPDPAVEAELSIPPADSKRLGLLAGRSRSGIDASGATLPSSRAITLRDALFETVVHHFAHDPKLVAYGEENRDWGGAFGVYRDLTELVPYHRLFNAPISEAAIISSAVGYAIEGGHALVELMYADFIGRAGDELFNQLAKWQAMSGGLLRMPVVVRVSVGSRYGAQHSQEWTSLPSHIPGLKVVYPATPYDAKGLLASALSGTDPVVFFESQLLYDTVELFRAEGVPAGYFRVPIGQPEVKQAGSDLTILTVGATLYRALEAARRLEREFGIGAELIDARSLVPFDERIVLESVRKTHRLLLASDAVGQGSYLHELANRVQELAFDELDAPVVVLGASNAIAPPAELEHAYFVQADDILDTVHERLLPLRGR
jgi:2-oxoisovalerate dehydrogenase E1 component